MANLEEEHDLVELTQLDSPPPAVETEMEEQIVPLEPQQELHEEEHHEHHRSDAERKWFEKMGQWESLDYESIDNSLYLEQLKQMTHRQKIIQNAGLWILLTIIGVTIGFFAFFIHFCVHHLQDLKLEITNSLMTSGKHTMAFLVAIVWCTTMMVGASLLITKVEPEATGSGIPEVKAYLNGVAARKNFNLRVLVIKVVGVILSVSSGIAAGYEGPMIHIGALVGDGVSSAESKALGITSKFSAFRHDRNRRDFITSGAATGLASAFTAPIGGTIFALEEVASYWPAYLTWQTLFVCITATWTNAALLYTQGESVIPFPVKSLATYNVLELIPFAITGVVCGLLGCLFNIVNLKINTQRKNFYATHQWYHKVVEVFAVAVLTTFIQFAVPLFWGCDKIPESATESMSEAFSKFGCPEGQYNEMATLLFNSQHSTIVTFFSRGSDLAEAVGLHTMAIFFVLYFGLSVITAGLAVPSGLFFPFLILGGCSGRFVGKLLYNAITHVYAWTNVDPGVYAMIGTAAFITGSTRMTISIGIILLELTDDIKFLLPILLAIAVAKNLSDPLVGPLYDELIELKSMPFVHPAHPTPEVDTSPITDVMTKDVVTFTEMERVGRVYDMLLHTKHCGFPVVSPSGNIKGLILRSQLLVLLNNKTAYVKDNETNRYLQEDQGILLNEIDDATAIVLIQQEQNKPKLVKEALGHNNIVVEEVVPVEPEVDAKGKKKKKKTKDVKEAFKHLIQAAAFEKSVDKNLTIEDVRLSTDEKHMCLDLRPYMHASPFFVSSKFTVARAFDLFRTMCLRHLAVVDGENRVIGILTRKDFIAAYHHHH